MVKSLKNKPNTPGTSQDWPYSQLRDETANQLGTPVDKEVYEDIHQYFMRLLDFAGITPNEDFDNAANGFQLFDAFLKLTQPEFASSLYTISQNATTGLKEIEVTDRFLECFVVSDPNGQQALEAINSPNHKAGDAVVLFFQNEIKIQGQSGGTDYSIALQNPAFASQPSITVIPGIPYVFRLGDSPNQWFLESSFIHLLDLLSTKANKFPEKNFKEISTDAVNGYEGNWGPDPAYSDRIGWYKDDRQHVYFQGTVREGSEESINLTLTICTLPLDVTPSEEIRCAANDPVNETVRRIYVKTNGQVQVDAAQPNSEVDLGQLQFKV
jgi:hypothetical protein